MILASVLFAAMGLLVKVASAEVSTGQVVLWRNAVSCAAMLPWALADRRRVALTLPGPVILRSLSGVASMFCYFTAISRLHLGDAVTLSYASPVLVALIAPRVLGERPPPGLWPALGLGFVGVALVAQPAFEGDPLGVAAGVATAVLAAVAYVYVRVATRTESSGAIVFWFSAVSTLAATPSLAMGSAWPAPGMVAALVGVGLLGLFAQLAMTRAYAAADAAVVSLYSYATPVLAYALGLVALGELPSVGGVAGVALVALAGVWVTPRAADVHGRSPDQEA